MIMTKQPIQSLYPFNFNLLFNKKWSYEIIHYMLTKPEDDDKAIYSTSISICL